MPDPVDTTKPFLFNTQLPEYPLLSTYPPVVPTHSDVGPLISAFGLIVITNSALPPQFNNVLLYVQLRVIVPELPVVCTTISFCCCLGIKVAPVPLASNDQLNVVDGHCGNL